VLFEQDPDFADATLGVEVCVSGASPLGRVGDEAFACYFAALGDDSDVSDSRSDFD